MATTVAAGSATGLRLAEQTVNAVSIPLYTVMMELHSTEPKDDLAGDNKEDPH